MGTPGVGLPILIHTQYGSGLTIEILYSTCPEWLGLGEHPDFFRDVGCMAWQRVRVSLRAVKTHGIVWRCNQGPKYPSHRDVQNTAEVLKILRHEQ